MQAASSFVKIAGSMGQGVSQPIVPQVDSSTVIQNPAPASTGYTGNAQPSAPQYQQSAYKQPSAYSVPQAGKSIAKIAGKKLIFRIFAGILAVAVVVTGVAVAPKLFSGDAPAPQGINEIIALQAGTDSQDDGSIIGLVNGTQYEAEGTLANINSEHLESVLYATNNSCALMLTSDPDNTSNKLLLLDENGFTLVAEDVVAYCLADSGTAVTYILEESGQNVLYRYDCETGEHTLIAQNVYSDHGTISLSPDGETLGYSLVEPHTGDYSVPGDVYIWTKNAPARMVDSQAWCFAVADEGEYIYSMSIKDAEPSDLSSYKDFTLELWVHSFQGEILLADYSNQDMLENFRFYLMSTE
jgi:hypothetical protein